MPSAKFNQNTPKPARRAVRIAQAYQNVFNTEEGKLVLADIVNKGYVNKSTYNGDPHASILNEGARTMALYILGMLNVNVNELIERIQTNANTLTNAE